MAERISGILFDLGDTLLDFGKLDIRSLFESGGRLAYAYLQELKLPLPAFARFHRRQNWAIRWSYLKSRITGREFNALDVMGRLGQRMGHDLTPEQMVELAWRWYTPLGQCAVVEPGTREMLGALARAGIRLGLVSNTFVPGQVLDRHLAQEGLLDLLPVRVYSCDVGFRKPDPGIFAVALSKLQTPADQTLFVGDSPAADIAGADRAGLIAVLKDPHDRFADEAHDARHRIRRLSELPAIVAGYNAD
jgi:HAD superfamily hydrolase (TIGR01549 family)